MNISHAINKATILLENFKQEGKLRGYFVEAKVFVTINSDNIKPLSLLEVSFTLDFQDEEGDCQHFYLTFIPSYDFERIFKTAIEGIYKEELDKDQQRVSERKQDAKDEFELDRNLLDSLM